MFSKKDKPKEDDKTKESTGERGEKLIRGLYG